MSHDDSKIDKKTIANYSAIDDFLKQYVTPQWFVLLIALVYASGFLCESIFFNGFGYHEMGGEFLRASYIYTGILFVFFPFSILIPILFSITLKRVESIQKKGKAKEVQSTTAEVKDSELPKEEFYFPYSTWITLFNLNLIFYLTIFAPHNFDAGWGLWLVALAILVGLCGPVAVDSLVSNSLRRGRWRWTVAIFVILCLDPIIYSQYTQHLKMMFLPGRAILYVFFMYMIFYITKRCTDHLPQIETGEGRSAMKLLGIFLSMMFWFFGIIVFALDVYPYIPVAKGGGYFLESPHVQLIFRNEVPLSVVTNYVNNAFIIVEQTDSSLFLAKITNDTDPNKWIEQRRFPSVVQVPRDEIAQITYTQYFDTAHSQSP